MYQMKFGLEVGSVLLLLIFSWIAGNRASRLLYSGSSERLRRKSRKLLFWASLSAIPALGALGSILWMTATLELPFWSDKVLLHIPLIGIPLAGVWLISIPIAWSLWRYAKHSSEAPMPFDFRRRSALPGLIVPLRALTLGAGLTLYFLFVPTVPWGTSNLIVPFLLYAGALIAIWTVHDQRFKRISNPDYVLIVPGKMKRILLSLRVWAIVIGMVTVGIVISSQTSKLSDEIDMMQGPADFGGGTVFAHADASNGGRSVALLTGPREEKPDRTFELTASAATVRLDSGESIEAWTFNGQLPGPELRMTEGELVEVTLMNKDIVEGVTLHWHGLDVPNAEDGVAGATQNAVMPGESYTYRFRIEQVGTFWYHSHQHSQEAVSKGLFGALIVEPKSELGGTASDPRTKDITIMTHLWYDAGGMAIGRSTGITKHTVAPGTPVRMRLINTDDWIRQTYTLVGSSFRVTAIDGTALNEPGELSDTTLTLTTGGRYDIEFTMPNRPVYLSIGVGGKPGVLLSPEGSAAQDTAVPAIPKTKPFDPLTYGKAAPTPFSSDSHFDREYTLILDNKIGFYNGRFNGLYTMNGKLFPETPMLMVREGELVKTTIVNRSMVDHPMHLHGHHALILSHNGKASTGSPLWTDTLDVVPGDIYEITFVADNPGFWMDHCHNLTHAAIGMSMHLMYEGVFTPYTVGNASGNHPE